MAFIGNRYGQILIIDRRSLKAKSRKNCLIWMCADDLVILSLGFGFLAFLKSSKSDSFNSCFEIQKILNLKTSYQIVRIRHSISFVFFLENELEINHNLNQPEHSISTSLWQKLSFESILYFKKFVTDIHSITAFTALFINKFSLKS